MREENAALQKKLDAPFEGAEELASLRQRAQEIADALNPVEDQAGAAELEDESEGEEKNEKKVKYSLRAFSDGRRFVDVEADQEQFDGLTLQEKTKKASEIIRKKFQGRVIGIDNPVYVNSESRREYGHPANRRISPTILEAKQMAAPELDNIIDAGIRLDINGNDGQYGHKHRKVERFEYYRTMFKVGKDYYEAVVNIIINSNGRTLKDVTQIKNVTERITDQYGKNPTSISLRDVSMNSISDAQRDVKDIKNVTKDITSSYGENPKSRFLRNVSMNIIPNFGGKVNDNSAQYSNRDTDTLSDRQLLARAYAGLAKTDGERKALERYPNKKPA